ncbi:MAG: class I SAM-dependent methyltransferase [Chitinophagaceae bacterium]|jgi:23S rRNA (cytosine1962-C5)-methyltransferase|nr:class I SAM-dependent methyltransferase [Chitinophagaceae bacterium]
MISPEKILMFENRLRKVCRHLSKIARSTGVSCYRVYDRDLPEFPLIIERYEEMVYVAEYRSRHTLDEVAYEAWLNESLEVIVRVMEVKPFNVFLKERKRKEGRGDQYRKTSDERDFRTVQEGGLKFLVNLSDYLDTGLFLDHRITRQMVREQSAGKKVLNLFCYTGSFSVYAASGAALEVCSVDLSNTYLGWARQNMELNGLFDPGKTFFVKADVLQYLPTVPDASYDLVILDPPTFSNSKMMKDILDIQADHVTLINDVLRVVRPGGSLYFSTNARTFNMEKERIQATEIRDITATTTPFDFKGKLLRWCYRIIR